MFVEPRGYSRVISHKTGNIIILAEGPFGSPASRTASMASSSSESSSQTSPAPIEIEASASREATDSATPPSGVSIIPPRLAPLDPPVVRSDREDNCTACSDIFLHIMNFFNRSR